MPKLLSEEIGMKLKALETSAFTTGGELSPEQEEKFVQYIRGSSDIMQIADVNVVDNHRGNIDSIYISGNVTEVSTEGQDAGESAIALIGQDTYETTKVHATINITNDFLIKNLEKEGFEDTITDMVIEAMGNDLGLLCVQGDTTGAGLLAAFDGFYVQSDSGHLIDADGADIDLSVFAAAFNKFPDSKRRKLRKSLRWVGHSRLFNDWDITANALTLANNDARVLGGNSTTPMGVPVELCDEIQTDLDATVSVATSAVVTATNAGPYLLDATNNVLNIDIDNAGVDAHSVLPVGLYRAVELASALNALFVANGDAAVADVDQLGRLRLTSSTTGAASELDIQAVANDMYTVVGFTVAVVTGEDAGANTVPRGTYMWLIDPKNFWVGLLNQMRIYWEFEPRTDLWGLTIYTELAALLRDPDAIVRVDDIILNTYI